MLKAWLRRHRIEITSGIGLLLIVLLAWSSESFQSCINAQQNTDAENAFYKSVSHVLVMGGVIRGCVGYFIDQSWESITALASILLAAITYMLVRLGADQGHTTRAQLRAYISPTVGRVKKFSLTEPIEIQVEIRNTGYTPARRCHTHAVVFVAVLPLPDDTKFPDPNEGTEKYSKGTIFPGNVRSVDGPSVDILVPDLVGHLKAADPVTAIYIAGESHYEDVFGYPHFSQFCLFINPDDTKKLIDAEERNAPIEIEVRFSQAHILNDDG
jgi:hypothetical protein